MAFLLALMVTPTAQGQSTQRLAATKANDYGLTYSLPVTALDITVEAETTVYEPGEFSIYAKKYLNIDNPVLTYSKTITLKSVVLTSSGIPNPDERYLITLKGGQSPYIVVTSEGLLMSVNTSQTAPKAEMELPKAKAAGESPLHSSIAHQVVTEDMLMSHSTAKRAQLAAEQIYEIRQNRSDILSGQADQMPGDGQAMSIVLNNLNAREEALMAMFIGDKTVSTEVKTISIVPEGDITNQVVCRLSAVNGIVGPDDLSGAPVTLDLNVTSYGELPVNEKGVRLPFPKGGIAYVIPGQAKAEVSFAGKIFAEKQMSFAQFGVVYGMAPSNFTDKKSPVYMIVEPATGAIVEVGPAGNSDSK